MRIKKQASKLNLNSITEEAAACRKAFKDFPVGGFTLHCHHEILGETLREQAENRIAYILSHKPQREQALRLRLFRPVSVIQLKSFKKAYADWQKADADWEKAYADRQKADADWQKAYADLAVLIHKKYCIKGCPWDGKTIFPRAI